MQETEEFVSVDTGISTFEAFFEAERDRLFRALCVATRNRNEAEEVLQDAFLSLWERWDRIDDIQDVRVYLYRTAMNAYISRRRRAALAIRKTLHLIPAIDPMADVDADDVVRRALADLPMKQRAAVLLTDVLDLPAEQAAQMLGMKAGAVRTAASRARASLRERAEETNHG